MKKFYTILSTMMILLITTSAGAFFTDDRKGFYEGDRQPGIKANDPFVKASTTFRDREAVPEGLTKTEWEKISTSIERARYRVQKDDCTGEYHAPNHAHSLDATFTREGFEVSPRKGEKGWNWGLSLSRYGYGSDLNAVPVAEKMITRDNRIEYHRGDMVEWYINDHRGLEQGFTLKARPSGRTGSEPLQLQMTTTTNLILGTQKDVKGIIFRDAQGKEVLRYSGLYAYDATGKDLGARMEAVHEGIRLIVDDHEAVYPITIDPFIETKKLLAGDGAAFDEFGRSVSISGDTAIIGAWGDGVGTGSAYIFSRDQGGADNWGQVKKLLADDGAVDDWFGICVSISGDTAIVGANGDDDNGSTSGSAYIFTRDEGGADNWGQIKKLLADDGAADDYFGICVSISGDTAIVGADGDDDKGSASGSAYIFSRDEGGTDNWEEVKKILADDGAADDYFGISVSISGDTAIVGAYWDDDNGYSSGSAYIFSRDHEGIDNWGQVKKLLADDGTVSNHFGLSVSISGDIAIVGAPYDDDNGGASGSAYIFSSDQGGIDNWGQVKKLLADDGAAVDCFGFSVSISGNTAIVGADGDDDNGSESGSAYVFSRDQGGENNWGEVQKLLAGDGAAGYKFGVSVSISGDTAIVGAYWDDDNGDYSGSAYIFLVPAFGDELALDFGLAGLWDYDGTNWQYISGSSENICGWSGGLAIEFTGAGLWNYDGTTWTPLAGSVPEGMADWSGGLAMDFGNHGLGLWSYDGTDWTFISSADVDSMTGWSGGLAIDFGTPGVWNYNNATWAPISGSSPEGMTGWSGGLAMDFDNIGLGLYNYDGTNWNYITSGVEDMAGWTNGLALDFGGAGVYNYDGTNWAFISVSSPEGMTGWSGGLAMDFDNIGLGLYNYDGTNWNYITSGIEDMDDVDLF